VKRVSLIAVLGVLCCLAAYPAQGSLAAATWARVPGPTNYHITRGHAERVAMSSHGVAGLRAVIPAAGAQPRSLLMGFRSPDGSFPSASVGKAAAPSARADALVRCLYDPGTRSFYFTEIGFPATISRAMEGNNTTADVVVMNERGVAAYQFDTSLGGNCFGDQPKVGFDNNALVISTDEFCGPADSNFEGAIALVISKPQLAAEDRAVNDAVLGPVSQAGVPVTGLDPAIGTRIGTEYLVNSVPFLASGGNNPAGNTLGLWTLRNDISVTSGPGTPVLTSRILPSEPYAFPVPAASTGNGSTSTADGLVVTSEEVLNPDDSRISGPVTVTRVPGGGIRLWTALDAAVTPSGDSAIRDGAAWFQTDPGDPRATRLNALPKHVVSATLDRVRRTHGRTVLGTMTSGQISVAIVNPGIRPVTAPRAPNHRLTYAVPYQRT
jgi:hypothetical protein